MNRERHDTFWNLKYCNKGKACMMMTAFLTEIAGGKVVFL